MIINYLIVDHVLFCFIAGSFILSSAILTAQTSSAKIAFKITVLYDNYVIKEGTKADGGFSCLIESAEKTILFDTGAKSDILWHNIKHMQVDIDGIDMIVLSHNHWDHVGGLDSILKEKQQVTVYVPESFPTEFLDKIEKSKNALIRVDESLKISTNVFLTGQMGDQIKEQSLILDTPKGLVIITGCSHQGIVNILEKAKNILDKEIFLVFGGFHLMRHLATGHFL